MRIEIRGSSLIPALGLLVAVAIAPAAGAHESEPHKAAPPTKAAAAPKANNPRAVAEAFNEALAAGDGDAAQALLLPNVLIYESGGAETSAAEYAGHHLPADMAFLAGIKREQLSQETGGKGDTVWVATRTRLSGKYKDKDVDLDSTETLVMHKTSGRWRIAHVHWSSAPHRAPAP